MRRITLILGILVALAAGPLFALDFGATLNNSTGYFTGDTPPFLQTDSLAFWFTSHLGQHLRFDIQASGNYQNQQTYGGNYQNPQSYGGYLLPYANLDRLTLKGTFTKIPSGPSLFNFTLGRFLWSDPTGDIYGQNLDGAQLTFAYPRVSLTTTLGYTGLTIKPSSTILMSKADVTGLSDQSQYFGSPRAVAAAVFKAPSLFLRQDLSLSAIVQEDLRPLFANNQLVASGTTTYSPTEGGPLDTQYFTAHLSGPLVSSLYWTGSFTLETGRMLSYLSSASDYQYEPILAYLATGGLRYFRPQLLGLQVAFDVIYASGDGDFTSFYEGNTNGDATAFIPITQAGVATVFSPALSNLITGGLSVSIKPLAASKNVNISNLQTILKVVPFLRPTVGPISTGDINTSSTQKYIGTEADATVNYRPFSDLGVGLSAGVFFPNAAAFNTPGSALQYGGRLDVSFSF